MTVNLRRTVMPEASAGSVDRKMRILRLVGVRCEGHPPHDA